METGLEPPGFSHGEIQAQRHLGGADPLGWCRNRCATYFTSSCKALHSRLVICKCN